MKVDLYCPVEILDCRLTGRDGNTSAFLMNHLGNETITGISLLLKDPAEPDDKGRVVEARGLKAEPGKRFEIKADTRGEIMEAVINKLWFENGEVWRRREGTTVSYSSNALPLGRALDRLRYAGGSDLVGYPQLLGECWICACGRANSHRQEVCARCHRSRADVFGKLNENAVEQFNAMQDERLKQASRKVNESNNILQENREKEMIRHKRHRKAALRALTIILLIAAAAAATILYGLPALKYGAAQDLLEKGNWSDARTAFTTLGDYRDSIRLIDKCDLMHADELRSKGTEEALNEAIGIYDAKGDTENGKACRYAAGLIMLEEERFEEAAEQFRGLGAYQDSADKAAEAVYRQAELLMQNGSYAAARILYLSLGQYSDCAEKAAECSGHIGMTELGKGNWLNAVNSLKEAPDSYAELLKEAYYGLAGQHLNNGLAEEAGNEYLLAGDYRDASARADECLYQLAQEEITNENYEKAQELFTLIRDYLDSEGQIRLCIYQRAVQMKQRGDFDEAADLFDQADGYDDSAAQYADCLYLRAMELLQEGDEETAESLLSEANDSPAAQKQLRTLRYQIAEAAYAKGEYAAALENYLALDSYKDSRNRIRQCRYALASAAMEAGDLTAAESYLTALGTYRNSKTLLMSCRYDIARQHTVNGEYEEAAAIFAELGSYQDSRTLLKQCRYALAVKALQSGDADTAIALLSRLGSYQDSTELLKQAKAAESEQQPETAADPGKQDDTFSVIAAANGDPANGETAAEEAKTSANADEGMSDDENPAGESPAVAVFTAQEETPADGQPGNTDVPAAADAAVSADSAQEKTAAEGLPGNTDAPAAADAAVSADSAQEKTEPEEQPSNGNTDMPAGTGAVEITAGETLPAESTEAVNASPAAEDAGAPSAVSTPEETAAPEITVRDPRMEEAAQLEAGGSMEAALKLYEDIGTEEAEQAALRCRYQAAASLMESGELTAAAEAFEQLGGYADAAAMAAKCRTEHTESLTSAANSLMESGDFAGVIALLKNENAEPFRTLYLKACYEEAERLYRSGKPYDALPYYQLATELEPAAAGKLLKNPYRLLGRWVTAEGTCAEFRENSTCLLEGSELCFRLEESTLYTGPDAEHLEKTHKLFSLKENTMTLLNLKEGSSFEFLREGEFVLPDAEDDDEP